MTTSSESVKHPGAMNIFVWVSRARQASTVRHLRERGTARAPAGLLQGDTTNASAVYEGRETLLVGAAGLWLPPLFFSSVYGAWRQTRLPGRTYQEVSNFLASRAKR